MKAYIWENIDTTDDIFLGFSDLIDADDVNDVVVFGDRNCAYKICDPSQADIQTLTKAFDKYCEYNKLHAPLSIGIEDLQNIVDALGIDADVEACDSVEIIPEGDYVIFDDFSNEFSLLSESYTRTRAYSENLIFDADTMTETEIEYNENKFCCLNDIDGCDMDFVGNDHEEYVYQIDKIDGEKVNDMYLIEREGGYDGHCARIFTESELNEYLEAIHCSFDDIDFE